MKKIISLILSIALLATLMPTILVSAADTAETVTVNISEDTFLYPNNNSDVPGGYGEEVYGDVTELQLADCANKAADNRHILMKAPLNSLSLETNRAVTKVELIINRVYNSGLHNSLKYSNLNVYNTSSNWSEGTTCLNHWNATRTDVYQGHLPSIYYDSADQKYMAIDATPDAIYSGALPKVEEANPYAQITLDVTSVFKKAFPNGQIGTDSELSMLVEWNYNDAYQVMAVASSEHETEAIRPKLVFTIDTIPAFTEVSHSEPEMLTDEFSLTMSNNIVSESSEVKLNGTTLTNAQYSINADTLTLNCDYVGLQENTVSVNLTDAYGQSFQQSYTFTPRGLNGADASGVIKKYITEDTMLNAQYANGDYGKGNYSSDKSMLFRSAGTDTHAALMKLDLSDISIPEGKTISNITLHLSAINDGNTNVNSIDVISHLVTGDFDMSTVTMKDFDGSATLTPDLDFDNPTSTGYPVGDADVTAKLSGLRASTPYSPTSMDITPLFIKKFPNGKLGEDKELAFTIFKQATGYGSNCFIALSEHDDKVARPYVTITLDDTIAESQKASEFYHYSYANQSAAEINDTKYIYKADVKDSETAKINNSVAMMKFALTEDYYDSFVVTYAPNGSGSQKAQRIYKFYNEDNKAGSALTYADFNDEIYEDAMFIGKPDENGTVDVADFANECVANGKDYMCLIISADTSSTTTIKATVPSAVAQKAIAPSISFTGSTPTVAGSYIKSIDAKFTTVLANSAAAKVELYKGATKVEDVTFVSKGNTIDFAAPTKLEENTSYTVVLKAGATDLFGNTTTEDIEIAAFTTGVDFVNHGIKLFAKDTDVEKDAFATTDGLTAATVGTEIQGYWRADNNAIEEKALIIAIGAYDDNNELLGVQFSAFDANDEETKIYKTNVLTVPTGATKIKAFGWDGTSQAGIAFAEIPVQ